MQKCVCGGESVTLYVCVWGGEDGGVDPYRVWVVCGGEGGVDPYWGVGWGGGVDPY